jgi:hypothetical protein
LGKFSGVASADEWHPSCSINESGGQRRSNEKEEKKMRNHLFTTLVVGVALAVSAGAASAKNGGSNNNIDLKANLNPCCAAASENNDGSAEYSKQTSNGATKQERFRTQAKVELPSAALGIVDAATAQAADVRVILTRNTVDYAECTLDFDVIAQELEIEDGQTVLANEAEFAIDIRNQLKKGHLVVRVGKGTCDVDLTTPGVQAGVPVVQSGDIATVTLVDPSEASLAPASRTLDKDFLQGTF